MDRRPPLAAIDAAFGVPALVTVPGGGGVAATVVRLPPRPVTYPGAGDLQTLESVQVIGLRRDQVPSVPTGTTIVVGAETFRVDSILEEDDELIKAVVR